MKHYGCWVQRVGFKNEQFWSFTRQCKATSRRAAIKSWRESENSNWIFSEEQWVVRELTEAEANSLNAPVY